MIRRVGWLVPALLLVLGGAWLCVAGWPAFGLLVVMVGCFMTVIGALV